MRRFVALFVIILIAGLGLVSCGSPEDEPAAATGSGAPAPGPTPTLDTGQPDGVAQAFLNAWMVDDYTGMYSLLSPNSQIEYSLEAFTDTYTSTATTMTLNSVEVALTNVLEQGTSAQARFHVTYDTRVLGAIERDLDMLLVFDGGRWGIAWTPGLIFEQLAGSNTLSLEVEIPSRANIYDRNGLWLVSADATTVTISVLRGEISTAYEEQMLDLLSHVLRQPPDEIKQNYDGLPEDWYVALGDTDAETVQENWSALNSYPGLYFAEKSGRRYFNVLASHVLGYTSFIPEDRLDLWISRGYRGDEVVGLSGLERWGESYLAGKRGGTLTAWTAGGQFFAEVAHTDPVPAQSLYTTLDRTLQTYVQDTIEDAYRVAEETWAPTSPGAAVVVLDVHTGEVLAMASYPYYDPNVLNPYNQHPLYTETYLQDIFNDPRRLFFNRAAQGQYPPGSVFKVVSMAAALGSGVYNVNTPYTCTGSWAGLGAANVKSDWLPEGHGTINLAQALTFSCDPYFYELGLRVGQADYNILPDYARQFGFGAELGIQIEEEPGLIPDPDWLLATRGEQWDLSDSVNMAIGQGDVLVTPLQVAVAMSAIANGGTVYRPQLVHHIGLIGEPPSWTFEPDIIGELPITPEDLAVMQDSLAQVASNPQGTAEYRLGSTEIPVAGKTGTAQAPGATAFPHAWFAGYAPADEPEIAIVVWIENGGQGSGVAAPIFRRIVELYYDLTVLDWPYDWTNPDAFDFILPDERGE